MDKTIISRQLKNAYKRLNHKEYKSPYKYKLKKGKQILYFFGSRHSYNPKDVQFVELRDFWDDFQKNVSGPYEVLIEGGKRSNKFKDEIEAIKKEGELGLVYFLGKKAGVKIDSPDLSDRDWFNGLAKIFNRDFVAYYDFIRVAYQWNRTDKSISFKKYASSFLKQNEKSVHWKDFDFSLKNMQRIHKELFKTPFDENDQNFLVSLLDVNSDKSVINEISRYDDEGFRDLKIIDNISKEWSKKLSLFIIFGAPHAIVMRDILKKIVGGGAK